MIGGTSYFVYVISNPVGRIYVGQSCDLEKRLARHNGLLPSKNKSYTKNKGPWKISYYEQYSTRAEAKIREKYLKSSIGRRYIKLRIARG